MLHIQAGRWLRKKHISIKMMVTFRLKLTIHSFFKPTVIMPAALQELTVHQLCSLLNVQYLGAGILP